VASLKFTVNLPTVPTMPTAGMTARIMSAFARNAGAMIVASVRNQLGSSSLYQLKPDYAARKPMLKGYRRQAGKSTDQPIILTGDIFDHVVWEATGDGLIVHVAESAGMDDRFDVSEHWEQITDYLGKGFDEVEADLPDVLLDIIFGEMLL
jgi:hypothetical protein